ncbi:MAG TPA: hypothetical protein VK469_05000, partial [Candidatus Kapabacteria bacterium]|nr:hypothetical protein [Candidatus Kapabacteria bacterium]
MKKVVFGISEGTQDVAFLYRIFSAAGFKSFNKKIADFPYPISNYLKKSLANMDMDLDKLKFDETRQKPIPQEVLSKDEILVLLYCMGGAD